MKSVRVFAVALCLTAAAISVSAGDIAQKQIRKSREGFFSRLARMVRNFAPLPPSANGDLAEPKPGPCTGPNC